ncbi:MAG: hypothetical protein F6J87_12310 [Spirulina sp. SIO3F2]|nr:hypothetical protein [Spirulina sp. SIO3F2]
MTQDESTPLNTEQPSEPDQPQNELTEEPNATLQSTNAAIAARHELDLTQKEILIPLALAGALGGFCNTGIQFVVPSNQDRIDFLPGEVKFLPGNSQFISEFFIYLIFSISVGAVLGPVVAMLSIGMPNKQNKNRLLVASVIFGTFLTVTIGIAQKSISTTERIQILEKQVIAKEEKVEDLEAEVDLQKNQVERQRTQVETINEAAHEVLGTKLPAVSQDSTTVNPTNTRLRVETLRETGCASQNIDVINENIVSLKTLRSEINITTSNTNIRDELLQQIDTSLADLIQCLNTSPPEDFLPAE